jgi:MoaA/NifB/PqqE/SkfB family radical SAM enzyme
VELGVRVKLATIARLAAARAGIAPAPIALVFELTHQCNLACVYCDRHTPGPGEMSCEQIFEALAGMHELGMRYLSLDGGDPLTHRHVGEIVDWACERGITLYMNSNGILVPRKLSVVQRVSMLKISLDGPPASHDAMRGQGSFAKAIAGARAARGAGVRVELTCVVGRHNVEALDELVDLVEEEGFRVVFQPARNSLFLGSARDGAGYQLEDERLRAAFRRIETRKHRSSAIGNAWSSLRHFRRFPEDVELPCAAGWITATMDPAGNLFHCGQVDRSDKRNNVVRMGARAAFAGLTRQGCGQCWCARTVEGNYLWGGRLDRVL